MAVLLREAIGDRLRHARTNQRRTLREVSRSARVSLGYLSEVERGQKEASSELLAAICEALELPLSELLHKVAGDVAAMDAMELESSEASGQSDAKGEIVNSSGNMPLRTTISSPGVRVFAA
ncbi:helix-turn-helix domain-containing protein [Thermocrispum municipale]|jgi:transcriptional regulator with XRE-family HTH domain|uniref:helix-turn-helix domain-containing protein n=1 Tax=Thermocrispum municipale TaxID=37926 RepID=UPI0003FA281C|nr:helix-turn-helix transcriptional regulator [Thermocrispum municipale]